MRRNAVFSTFGMCVLIYICTGVCVCIRVCYMCTNSALHSHTSNSCNNLCNNLCINAGKMSTSIVSFKWCVEFFYCFCFILNLYLNNCCLKCVVNNKELFKQFFLCKVIKCVHYVWYISLDYTHIHIPTNLHIFIYSYIYTYICKATHEYSSLDKFCDLILHFVE